MQFRVSLLALLLLSGASGAQSLPDAGTDANLGLGAGSRGVAFGGAMLADLRDPSAVYWNPATLALQERSSLMLMHAPIRFGDATQSFVGLEVPTLRAGHFGLGVMRLGTGGIQSFDAASRPLGEIEFAETAAYLSYATAPRLVAQRLALGLTVKSLTQVLGSLSSTGVGLDLGMRAELMRSRWAAACMLQNAVAPELVLDRDVERIPTVLRVGSTIRFGAAASNLALHVGADYQSERGWRPEGGLEYQYKDRLSLRVGNSQHGLAVGFGIRWERFALDYARVSQEGAMVHPVTATVDLGSSLSERLAAEELARQQDREAALESRLAGMVAGHLEQAQLSYDQGDYAAALDEWKLAANLEPDNELARNGMESAQARLSEQRANSIRDQTAAMARVAQFEVGLRYYSANDYAPARNVWLRLLEQDPNDVVVRQYLVKTEEGLRAEVRKHADAARHYERKGDWVSAVTEWNQVQSMDALHPESGPGLARCRAALERSRTAASTRPPAVLEPSRAELVESRYQKAQAQYHSEEFEAARTTLRELLKLAPQHEDAKRLLALCERRLTPLTAEERETVRRLYVKGLEEFTAGRYETAIAEWQRILAFDPGNESVARNIEEAQDRLRDERSQ